MSSRRPECHPRERPVSRYCRRSHTSSCRGTVSKPVAWAPTDAGAATHRRRLDVECHVPALGWSIRDGTARQAADMMPMHGSRSLHRGGGHPRADSRVASRRMVQTTDRGAESLPQHCRRLARSATSSLVQACLRPSAPDLQASQEDWGHEPSWASSLPCCRAFPFS